MKKVLLVGDYSLATWHPLRGVDDELSRILSIYDLTITEDYDKLSIEELKEYDFVVNYIDAYDLRANSSLAALFISYVADGGAMMVIHNGIISRKLPELEQMVGGAFTHHPKHEKISFVPVDSHPLGKTIMPFEIDEEPYMFTMSNLAKLSIVMNYEYQNELYPAVWLRSFGKGKVIYIAPGHNAESFKNEGLELLVQQGALWCCNELDFPQDNIYTKD